jgi:hypothetical protein
LCDFRSLYFVQYSRKHNLTDHQVLNTKMLEKLQSVGIVDIIENKENAIHQSCTLYRAAAQSLFTENGDSVIKVYEDENIIHYKIVNATESALPSP